MTARFLETSLALLFAALMVGDVSLADPPREQNLPGAPSVETSPMTARFAIPSDTGHYVGYYVGGGAALFRKSEPRRPDEGTWGFDYQGWLIPRRVMLQWWHGRRYQGGTGAYQTEGPKLLHGEDKAK